MLAPLRNRRFFSLGELNQAIAEKVAEVNARQFRGQPSSRRDLFLEIERPALQPLPPARYEFTEIKKATPISIITSPTTSASTRSPTS